MTDVPGFDMRHAAPKKADTFWALFHAGYALAPTLSGAPDRQPQRESRWNSFGRASEAGVVFW